MEITNKQKRLLELAANDGNDKDLLIVETIGELEDKIDHINGKIDSSLLDISEQLKKNLQSLEEELVYEVDEEKIASNVLAKIPTPKDGNDYVLTDEDKMEIALSIDVPVVEKVIEKTETIVEQPIVTNEITNEIKEVAVTDKPEVIAEKLNTLKEVVEPEVIKGYKDLRRIVNENANKLYTGVSETRVRELLAQNPSGSVSPLTTKGDIYGYDTADARIPVGADGEVLTADSTNALGVSWQPVASSAVLTYMFANIVSDIGATYLQAVSLNSYTVGTKSDQSGTATTSGVTIGRFATNLGFPNITLIPVGTITIHYDTEKGAGSNNYYSYAQIYKRNLAGTETLLATSDNSPQTASNTQQNVTVTAVLASDISILSTDRIVVKVVAVMVSSTATIHVYGDDATGARIELPTAQIDATNYVTITGDQSITGTKTFLKAGIGTTPTDAVVLSNTTAATSGNQQISPSAHWSGRGWNSGGAGSSQSIDFRKYLLPVQGASGATGRLITQISRNGAAYSDIYSQSTTGEIVQTVLSGVSATTGYEMTANFANSDTQTTQHLKLSNSGTNTWTTYYFASVQKGAMGVDSSGVMRFYGSGNRYLFHTGVTGSTVIAEIYSGGFYNTGGNFNSGRVTAGSNTTSPPSTLTNYGSTSLYTTVINTPTTLDDSMTQVIVDCSTYNVCSGTPSTTDCGTYTGSGQATCESHLPCVWDAGTACSIYDNEAGMTSCSGQPGCSVSTSSCSSANNTDQSTCEALDDAYGGSCSWDTATCSAQTSTASCNAITGCTASVTGDCSTLSDGGGDGTNCATQPECSYDSGTGACSGSYFTSCSGNLCGGDYYNGICNGTFGTACSGTATCSGYLSSGACTAEAGCSWTSGVAVTLPASPVFKTYWIAKDYTSGTLTILPNSGQTVNNTTSITSSSTTGVSWMLSWVESKSNWYIMSKH